MSTTPICKPCCESSPAILNFYFQFTDKEMKTQRCYVEGRCGVPPPFTQHPGSPSSSQHRRLPLGHMESLPGEEAASWIATYTPQVSSPSRIASHTPPGKGTKLRPPACIWSISRGLSRIQVLQPPVELYHHPPFASLQSDFPHSLLSVDLQSLSPVNILRADPCFKAWYLGNPT